MAQVGSNDKKKIWRPKISVDCSFKVNFGVPQVGFMKTHKTASSTVQNILMRYGRQHDWNFVMMKVRNVTNVMVE